MSKNRWERLRSALSKGFRDNAWTTKHDGKEFRLIKGDDVWHLYEVDATDATATSVRNGHQPVSFGSNLKDAQKHAVAFLDSGKVPGTPATPAVSSPEPETASV